jgi:uncharacterized protein YwbE
MDAVKEGMKVDVLDKKTKKWIAGTVMKIDRVSTTEM